MNTLDDCIAIIQDIPDLRDIVDELHAIQDPDVLENVIPKFRKALQAILHDTTKSALHDKTYQSLIMLAELHPLNTEDPITFDEISPDNRVVISTGHQFDINTLLDYHRARPAKEVDDDLILNFNTGLLMNERDEARVRQEGIKRGLSTERQSSKTPDELWVERSHIMERILTARYFYDIYELRSISPNVYARDSFEQDIQNWADQNEEMMLEPMVEGGYLTEEDKSTLSQEQKGILIHASSAVLKGLMSIEEAKTLSWEDSFRFYYCRYLMVIDPTGDYEEEYNFFMNLIADNELTWQEYIAFPPRLMEALFDFREKILDKSISIQVIKSFMQEPTVSLDKHWKNKLRVLLSGDVYRLLDAKVLTARDASRLCDYHGEEQPDIYPFRSTSVWTLITNGVIGIEDAKHLTREDLHLLAKSKNDPIDVIYDLSIMKGAGPGMSHKG